MSDPDWGTPEHAEELTSRRPVWIKVTAVVVVLVLVLAVLVGLIGG